MRKDHISDPFAELKRKHITKVKKETARRVISGHNT